MSIMDQKQQPMSKMQAKELVKEMLSEGWAIVFGEVESIEKFEHTVYPPDTLKSADFRVISLPRASICLAKKNDDLIKLLHTPSSISEVVGIYISQQPGVSDEKHPIQVHAMAVEPRFVDGFVEDVFFSALNAAPSSFSKYIRKPEKF
jgi:hypothetical protein